MPTYEYRCPACGHQFDQFQRMSDPPEAPCPKCETSAVRKLSGGGGFVLKGSGFYSTDYRSESYKKAAKAEKGEGGSSSDSSASDSKKKPDTSASSDKTAA